MTRIAYLLDDTPISGLVRTVLAHADALIGRGHTVRIVTTGTPVTWRSSRAEWLTVDEFGRLDDDVVIATSSSHAQYATLHLVDKPGDTSDKPALPLARFAIVDDEVYRPRTAPENEPPRVLLAGASQNASNAIDDGYGAAAHARWFHQKLELVRVSPWTPSREEPLDSVQEFHIALTTAEMRRLMHSCDLVIAPAHADAGFDLTAAEALASGLPLLMSTTPAHAFDDRDDFAQFGPDDNAVELGEKLIELLSDEALRTRLRLRGREVAEQWRADAVAERLERALLRL